MGDEKILNGINKLLATIEEKKTPRNEIEHIKALNCLFELVHTLSTETKSVVREQLFGHQVNLGIAYFRICDHENALKMAERAKKLNGFIVSDIEIRYYILHIISHSKLYLGIKKRDDKYVNEAEGMILTEFNQVEKIKNHFLKQAILDDRIIIDAYKNTFLVTTVKMEIPTVFLLDFNSTYNFLYEETKCEIRFINRSEEENYQFIEMEYDKYGLVQKNEICISMNRYFEHDLFSEDHSNILPYSIKVINYFIERYRLATNRFWTENLNKYWITSYSFEIKAGEHLLRNCPVFDPRKYKVYANNCIFSELEQQQLNGLLSVPTLPLWRTMVQVAKDFILVHRYREAIFALNCAFENFIETEIRMILMNHMGEEKTEIYLKGSASYDDFRLKKYLTRKQFEEAVTAGLIETKPPSTYSILKKCNTFLEIGLSGSQITKLVNEIRANRNEIIHGRDYNANYGALDQSVPYSIEKFDELIDLLKIPILY